MKKVLFSVAIVATIAGALMTSCKKEKGVYAAPLSQTCYGSHI